MARVALIGATGLIGRSLAPLLVAAGNELHVLTRRPAGVAGAVEHVAEMADWPALLAGVPVDVAISALGTTWRKAGDWATFEGIDRHAVVDFARAARKAGAQHMILVSSVGADATSANRYLAIKGAVESDLAGLGFERLDIVRPGLLTGPRGKDRRTGERFAILISPLTNLLLRGTFGRFRAIRAATVAAAMARLPNQAEPGRFVHHNREIAALARR